VSGRDAENSSARQGRSAVDESRAPAVFPGAKTFLTGSFPYGPLLVTGVLTILAVRMFRILNAYAVNIFFSDEWDFRLPQFQGASLWRIFTWQHGPPRLGIGFVVDTLVNRITRWDSRGTTFLEGAVMLAAAICALWLKRRLFGRITVSDVVIPIIFLVPSQYLAFVATPIVAHGPFPAFLTVLFCLAWTVRNRLHRYAVVLIVNFLLIYTGFGTFVGFITPVLFVVEIFHTLQRRDRWWIPFAALAISILSLGSFFIGYKVAPAAGCLTYARAPLLHYVWFAGLIFASFFSRYGHSFLPSSLGIAVMAAMLVACCWYGYRFLRLRTDTRLEVTGLSLTGLSLLFAINAAIGRICLGIDAADAARYMPYLTVGFLGIYFFVLSVRRRFAGRVMVGIFVVAMLVGATPFTPRDKRGLAGEHAGKQAWKDCYLKYENVDYCDTRIGFRVYPIPAATHLEQKLQFLKAHHLNLFNGD